MTRENKLLNREFPDYVLEAHDIMKERARKEGVSVLDLVGGGGIDSELELEEQEKRRPSANVKRKGVAKRRRDSETQGTSLPKGSEKKKKKMAGTVSAPNRAKVENEKPIVAVSNFSQSSLRCAEFRC